MIPTDAQERKDIPVFSGFACYFPNAIIEVAKLSKRGNEQHNRGSELHWDRTKSGDELDALNRHLLGIAAAENYTDELEHATAVAWRAMANLQKTIEQGPDAVTKAQSSVQDLLSARYGIESLDSQKNPEPKLTGEARRDKIIEQAADADRLKQDDYIVRLNKNWDGDLT